MSLEVHAADNVRTVLWKVPPSSLLLLADHTLKMENVISHTTQYAMSTQRTNGCKHMSWYIYIVGSNSHRLDGMRIENRTASERLWDPLSLLYNVHLCSFRGRVMVKRLGCGVNHPRQFSVEVKERVQPYLYSPSMLSWQVME